MNMKPASENCQLSSIIRTFSTLFSPLNSKNTCKLQKLIKSNVFCLFPTTILALFIEKKNILLPLRKSYLGDRGGVIICAFYYVK